MQSNPDPLLNATERLEVTLSADVPGHEQEWTVHVQGALLALENALRTHKTATEGQQGMYASLDSLAPETLPTLDRHVHKLCEDHNQFLKQVGTLREDIHSALQAFQPRLKPAAPATAAGVPDFGSIRQRCAELVATVRQHKEAETKLLLETATTDTGVGD